MNLRSEIEFYSELRLLDKARLLNLFLHELADEARGTYGPGLEQVHDGAHLRFVNEITHRITRVIEQLLAEEATRPSDDVVLRMLLSPRADKVAERLVYNAYSRAIQGFESYDTTVLMGS
jgi:exoribonuclease II